MDNRPISEQLLVTGTEWADAEAAASLLRDTKSAVLSQRMLPLVETGMAVNKAEMQIKGSEEWLDHLTKINKAEHHANLLKVRLEHLRAKLQEWISEDANHRLQARL